MTNSIDTCHFQDLAKKDPKMSATAPYAAMTAIKAVILCPYGVKTMPYIPASLK